MYSLSVYKVMHHKLWGKYHCVNLKSVFKNPTLLKFI